jgi:hypothetical protein
LERGAARGRSEEEWIGDGQSLVYRYVNDDASDYAHRIEQDVKLTLPRAVVVDVASTFLVALGVFWFVSRSYV